MTSQAEPPRAAKPPFAVGQPWALRFRLGVDCVAGTVLDLDFATGLLVPAPAEAVMLAELEQPVGMAVSGDSPGMMLRALAEGWRERARQVQAGCGTVCAEDCPRKVLARESIACAGELDAALDAVGVAKP